MRFSGLLFLEKNLSNFFSFLYLIHLFSFLLIFIFLLFILGIQLDAKMVKRIGENFLSVSVSDEQTLETMKELKNDFQFTLCPHSGVF